MRTRTVWWAVSPRFKGPRPFGRGNEKPVRYAWGAMHTSMGPQAFRSRKSRRTTLSLLSHPSLQWGRGLSVAEMRLGYHYEQPPQNFNGATAFRSRKWRVRHLPLRCRIGLQWGRGLSVAEIIAVVSGRQAGRGLQWGRGLSVAEITRPLPWAPPPPDILQWGRRPFGRGNKTGKTRFSSTFPTSMGPRPFGRGNLVWGEH